MKRIISIKPHHFVDIITSIGAGKTFTPHPYKHDLHRVAQDILDNHDVLLQIELGADDICKPCIHNIDGLCDDIIDTSYRPQAPSSKREWNLLIDKRWCERLKIGHGDRLTACEYCNRLRELADNIIDIYREIPVKRTINRELYLKKGIKIFLAFAES